MYGADAEDKKAEDSITSSTRVNLDEENHSSDEELDDDDYASFGLMRRTDSTRFEDMDFAGMVPLLVEGASGRVNELPPERTPQEIQPAKAAYQQSVPQVKGDIRKRSIEILMLRVTEPQRR